MRFKDSSIFMTALIMAVFFGTVAVLSSLTDSDALRFLVTSLPFKIAITSVFGIFLLLALYFVRRNYAKYEDKIRAKGKTGEFYVAVSAIEESLERVSTNLPEVLYARVIVFKDRKGAEPVLVRIYFHALEDTIVPDVTDKIRKSLSFRLDQIIGAESNPNFEINLVRITTKEEKERKVSHKKGQEVIDLSKGPIYPVQ